MPRSTLVVLALAASLACRVERRAPRDTSAAETAPAVRFGLGEPASPAQIAAVDVDVATAGHGLPPGHGSALEGEALFRAKCAACHGPAGQGIPPLYPALVGREPRNGFPFAQDARFVKTIGNYWPYATTLFDYIRRAMPFIAPGSLTNDEVYTLTAYLLAANGIIAPAAVLDSAALVRVRMPARDRFVPDDRRGGAAIK
jgi:cytochrome c